MTDIYLGTVAIEPNRWATVAPDWRATIDLSEWLDQIESAGFDGLEVWEKHLTQADDDEVDAVLNHDLPVALLNSYASFDDADADVGARAQVARWIERCGAGGIKYNLGNDPTALDNYAGRLAEWAELMPSGTRLLCECHEGISIMEDPEVAATVFAAAGGGPQLQAISHLGEQPEYLRSKFEHLGDRITHIHVNFLAEGQAPRLTDIEERVISQIELVKSLGFAGTWSVEFTAGLLTENDNPGYLIESATADLVLLREVIDG